MMCKFYARHMGRTTVALYESTKRRLRKRGDFGDSYDDVVRRLLEDTDT
jgi:hypothetical protein